MHALKIEDELLFMAVCDFGPPAVKKAIQAKANVNAFREDGTPLIVATKNADCRSILETLLDSGALANIVDRNFHAAIEIAAEKYRYNALSLLLERRESFLSEGWKSVFSGYLKYCVDHYIDRPGQEFEAQNHALIAHYASRLAGANVGQLFASDYSDEKYVVHLYAFRNAARGQVSLEGWKPQFFLPLRIYSFFEIFVKLTKGIIKPKTANSLSLFNLSELIETEILMACEALRTVRDRLAIDRFNDGVSEGNNDLPQDDPGEDHNDEQDDDNIQDDADEEDLPTKIDNLYEKLARGILSRLASLQESQSYSVSIGFIDHEIYLTNTCLNGHILCRIDNLGYGSEYHLRDAGNSQRILPFQLCSILKDRIQDDPDMTAYLAEVLKVKSREKTVAKEKLANIYSCRLRRVHNSWAREWPQMVPQQQQVAGNCVLESQQFGLFQRLDTESFEWLLNQERQCVVNQDRKQYGPKANDDKYWREELLGDPGIWEKPYAFAFEPFPVNRTLLDLLDLWVVTTTGNFSAPENYRKELEYKQSSRNRGMYPGNTFEFNLCDAYERQDFAQLFEFAKSFWNSHVENPGRTEDDQLRKRKCYLQFRLCFLVGALFENQTEDTVIYGQLEPCFKDLIQNDLMNDIFLLIKGIVDLKRAHYYGSTFLFYQAKEYLGYVPDYTSPFPHAVPNFFKYYLLGICEYYLNNLQAAYENFSKALSKIKQIPHFSNAAQFKIQECSVCLGYVALQLEKTEQALGHFQDAQRVIFEVEEDHPVLVGRKHKVRKELVSENAYLGSGICCERQVSQRNVVEDKIELYSLAEKYFERSKFSTNPNVYHLAERKLQEVRNKIYKLKNPQDNHPFFRKTQEKVKLKKWERSLKRHRDNDSVNQNHPSVGRVRMRRDQNEID